MLATKPTSLRPKAWSAFARQTNVRAGGGRAGLARMPSRLAFQGLSVLAWPAPGLEGEPLFWLRTPGFGSYNQEQLLLLVVATIPRRRALRASWRALRAQSQNLRRALRALGRQGGRASLPGLSSLPQPGCWFAWRVGSMLSASGSWAPSPAQIALRCGNAAHELTSERFAHRAGPGPKPGESQPRPGQAWQGQQDTAGPGGPACPQGRPTLKIWVCAWLGFEPENPA